MTDTTQAGPATGPEPRIYKVVRFRENGRPRVIRQRLTLSEARQWCQRPDTHGIRAGRRWFDGYTTMAGRSLSDD
jgi:hypothetical protein